MGSGEQLECAQTQKEQVKALTKDVEIATKRVEHYRHGAAVEEVERGKFEVKKRGGLAERH